MAGEVCAASTPRLRGSTWWIDFTTPSGERVRRSAETGSKAEAQELHDRLRAESWRINKLGERPPSIPGMMPSINGCRRRRWITPEQVETLLAKLPPHQHDTARACHRLTTKQRHGLEVGANRVRRYAHLALAQMAKRAAVVSALLHDTTAAQGGAKTDCRENKKRSHDFS